jgi:hypothetical protein
MDPPRGQIPPVANVPLLEDVIWDPWAPDQVAREIGTTSIPWCVTAGWAIDLFIGEQTREHDDIEIAVPSSSWPEIRNRLARLEFVVAGSGHLFPLESSAFEEHFQTWGRDSDGVFRLDVFRDPHEGATWICRRSPEIRLPYTSVIAFTASGVPFMVPEVVLLFKAKHDRDKDRTDLEAALAKMSPARVAWLIAALDVVHPDHPWMAILEG